jgi:hypothetical protein
VDIKVECASKRYNRAYGILEELSDMNDKIKMKIAWVLPKWLVYWAGIRMAAHATQGEWGHEYPDDVSVMDMLKRW